MITSPKFILNTQDTDYLPETGDCILCATELRRIFRFSRNAPTIQFKAWLRPRLNTVKIVFDYELCAAYIGGQPYYLRYLTTQFIKKLTKGHTVLYISLIYWDSI